MLFMKINNVLIDLGVPGLLVCTLLINILNPFSVPGYPTKKGVADCCGFLITLYL